MKSLLWLDNALSPFEDNLASLFSPIGTQGVIITWLHTYAEFEQNIIANGLPEGICFDYDLGEDKTGFDCARFLVRYCMNYTLPLPKYAFQSDDRRGQESMKIIFQRYEHFYDSVQPKIGYDALVADGFDNELPF